MSNIVNEHSVWAVFRPFSYRLVLEDPKLGKDRPIQWFEGSKRDAMESANESLKRSAPGSKVYIYKIEEKLDQTLEKPIEKVVEKTIDPAI